MDKAGLLEAIRKQLKAELDSMTEAARAAHEAATHEESRAEDAHDTRSIEAGYLAGAQRARVEELQGHLEFFSRLEPRSFAPDEPIGPGALVELEAEDAKCSWYFLAAQAGGMSVRFTDHTVQILTPRSPVGEELEGRRAGESFEIEQRGSSREFTILSVR